MFTRSSMTYRGETDEPCRRSSPIRRALADVAIAHNKADQIDSRARNVCRDDRYDHELSDLFARPVISQDAKREVSTQS